VPALTAPEEGAGGRRPADGELHGFTVVVATRAGGLCVGRCDELCEGRLRLRDAAWQPPGDAAARAAFLRAAAERGVWKQHDSVSIPLRDVREVRWLGEPGWLAPSAAPAPSAPGGTADGAGADGAGADGAGAEAEAVEAAAAAAPVA